MKLTVLFLTVAFFNVSAAGIAQNITFKAKAASLESVLKEVKRQTGYVVVYTDDILTDSKPVSIVAKNLPLEIFMQEVLTDQPIDFSIEYNTVFLSKKSSVQLLIDSVKLNSPISVLLNRTVREITGVVYDQKTNQMLGNVTVQVSGTNKATQSDEKGRFSFKVVDDNSVVLLLTCIGYEKKTVRVGRNVNNVSVGLNVATSELDEAVVQAYGVTSKRLSTGNIVKVSGDEIRRQVTQNPLLALAGKVPGLLINPTTGAAASPVKMEIRGRKTLNPNDITEPLIVIDGIPLSVPNVKGFGLQSEPGVSAGLIQGGVSTSRGQSPLFGFNPADIESIEILKDGDATAIYGTRGANGVILITTKRAKPGKASFSAGIGQGLLLRPRPPRMPNLKEYLQIRRDAMKNDGLTPTINNAPDLVLWDTTRYTDWVKEILGTGRELTAYASFSGGDNKTSFLASANYNKSKELLNRSGSTSSGNLSLAVTHTSLDQKLRINLRTGWTTTKVDAINELNQLFTAPPNTPPAFDDAGKLNYLAYGPQDLFFPFPYGPLLDQGIAKTNQLSSSLSLSYVIAKGLTISASVGSMISYGNNDFYSPKAGTDPRSNLTGRMTSSSTRFNQLVVEPQISYVKSISSGKLEVQLIGNTERRFTKVITTAGTGYTNDNLIKSLSNATSFYSSDAFSEQRVAGIRGRVAYNWDSKYIISVNMSRDGSSSFAPGRQYGNFGSAAFAWIASEENWMQGLLPAWISFAKLNGGYAITGSSAVGDYEYLSQYAAQQPGSSIPMYDYDGVHPYVPKTPKNQNYHWGSHKSLDAGLSLGFVENRFNLDIAWYRGRTGDQLTTIPAPDHSGFPNVVSNWKALIQNTGVEAGLSAAIVRTKELRVNFRFNIGKSANKLIRYPGIERGPYANLYEIGKSVNIIYLLHYTGVDPLTGVHTFEDYSKDGKINVNSSVRPGTKDDDRYIALDRTPEYAGGFGVDVRWKNLGVNLHFTYANQVGSNAYITIETGRMQSVVMPPGYMDSYWRKPGDHAKYAKPSTIVTRRIGSSDIAYINSSYLQLANVSISFALPQSLLNKAKFQSCNFSLDAQNLFKITKYLQDPQISRGTYFPMPVGVRGKLSFTF